MPVGGERGAMAGPRGRVPGRQAREHRGHAVLEPANGRAARLAEPEPVVAEHRGDRVVQQPAVQQPGQRVRGAPVRGRRGVHVVVAERVQPEHGEVRMAAVQPREILREAEHAVGRGPRAQAERHAAVPGNGQQPLGRQHVWPRVVVRRCVPEPVFAGVVRSHVRFVFHVRRHVTCGIRARQLVKQGSVFDGANVQFFLFLFPYSILLWYTPYSMTVRAECSAFTLTDYLTETMNILPSVFLYTFRCF